MQFPIVREYKTDIDNSNLENEKRNEPFKVEAGVWTRVIVPRHSPFFVTSLKLYFPNGAPMIYGEHYRMYKLMPRLTDLAAQEVGCLIELMQDGITEGTMDYDVVGEFSLFDSTMLNLIVNAGNDDRPVWWDDLGNKPVVWRPKLHGHSVLYDIVAWQDMIELMSLIITLMQDNGRQLIEVKIDHYYDLFTHLMGVYKTMLLNFIRNHVDAEDEHGLTALQVHLEKVDNFATATKEQALTPRSDLHLTVDGLAAIIDKFGFNASEFMVKDLLPISQFGSGSFIPPNIEGVFDGLGGISETAGITMESDGTLTFLWNRMDGRMSGLYYSVIEDPERPELVYTGFKYTHPRITADAASVNLIAQGSGKDVMLVADSVKELFYLGVSNGSLDPARHVYSKLNLSALTAVFGAGAKISNYIKQLNVALMGDWIYIFAAQGTDLTVNADYRRRYFFRVPKASVLAQQPVTAAAVSISFEDGDQVQRNNAPYWQWGTPVGTGTNLNKHYFTFTRPAAEIVCYGCTRGQVTFVQPVPNNPDEFLVKFASAFFVAHLPTGKGIKTMVDMTYLYNPTTGVMTLINKTPNWTLDPVSPPTFPASPAEMFFNTDQIGAEVLDNGSIVFSGGLQDSFPRLAGMFTRALSTNRYDTLKLNWSTDLDPLSDKWSVREKMISPLASGIKPRSFMLGNGGDYYVATDKDNKSSLFYRNAPGRLTQRPGITNLFYNQVRSRPLSNDVRKVNLPPVVGGFTITMPSNYLSGFGTDVGDHAFCVSCQKKHLDEYEWPATWPRGTNPEDVMLVSSHTRQIESDGSITIVPTGTILYPAAIVEQLKQFVGNLPALNRSPKVFVTICDPSGLAAKYGWLPMFVYITYVDPGSATRYTTMLSIQPTYSGTTDRVVTGFSRLNWAHATAPAAGEVTATDWSGRLGGADPDVPFGPMRAGYYLHDDPEQGFNKLNTFFESGVVNMGLTEWVSAYGAVGMSNRNNRTWDTVVMESPYASQSQYFSVVPDNGVDAMVKYTKSTGGAGALFLDTRSVAQPSTAVNLLGSVYPETGWVVFFKTRIKAVFNGKVYYAKPGIVDLRDLFSDPSWKTLYVYCLLENGAAKYEISQDKRLDSPYQLWVATITTNAQQIVSIERYNVLAVNGHRISETKRGNAIPASSGLANEEGRTPWIRSNELLP